MTFQGKNFTFNEAVRPNELSSTELIRLINTIPSNNEIVSKEASRLGIPKPIIYTGIAIKDIVIKNNKNEEILTKGSAFRIPASLMSVPKYQLEVYDTTGYIFNSEFYLTKYFTGDTLLVIPKKDNIALENITVIFNPYNRAIIPVEANKNTILSKLDPLVAGGFSALSFKTGSHEFSVTEITTNTENYILSGKSVATEIIISESCTASNTTTMNGKQIFDSIYYYPLMNSTNKFKLEADYRIGKTIIEEAGLNAASFRLYRQLNPSMIITDLQDPNFDPNLVLIGISPLGNSLKKLIEYPKSKNKIIENICKTDMFIPGSNHYRVGKKYISNGIYEHGVISKVLPFSSKLFTLDIGDKITSPQKIKYLRTFMHGNTVNFGSHVVEIQAYLKDGTNVALNKTPRCINPDGSNNSNNSNLTRVTDGVLSTLEYSALQDNALSGIEINLGQLYDINSIKIWHYYGDNRQYKFVTVEVSPDGINWFKIFDSEIDGQFTAVAEGKEFFLNSDRLPKSSQKPTKVNTLVPEYIEGMVEEINGEVILSVVPGSGRYYAFIKHHFNPENLVIKLAENTSKVIDHTGKLDGLSIIYNDTEGWFGTPDIIEPKWKALTGTKFSMNITDLYAGFNFESSYDRFEPQILEILKTFNIPYIYTIESMDPQYWNDRVYTRPLVGSDTFNPINMLTMLKTDKNRVIIDKHLASFNLQVLPGAKIEKLNLGTQTKLNDHILELSDFIIGVDALIINGIIIRSTKLQEKMNKYYIIYDFPEVIKDVRIIRSNTSDRFVTSKINEVYMVDIQRGFTESLGVFANKPTIVNDVAFLQPSNLETSIKGGLDVLVNDYIGNGRLTNIIAANTPSEMTMTKVDLISKFPMLSAEVSLGYDGPNKERIVIKANNNLSRRGYIVR